MTTAPEPRPPVVARCNCCRKGKRVELRGTGILMCVLCDRMPDREMKER